MPHPMIAGIPRLAMGLAWATLLALYLGWALGLGAWIAPTVALVLVAAVAATLVTEAGAGRWQGSVFVLVLVLIALGSPSGEWDARSIWLFHAKRIYFDQSLAAQLDGYAPWSHNDYPVLVPAVSASLAALVGRWNEAFPKVAGVLVLAPALFVLLARLPSIPRLAFLALLVASAGNLLVNGYMDAIVAVYFVAAFVLARDLVEGTKQDGVATQPGLAAAVATVAVFAVLTLLKNEGLVALACIVLAWLACALHRGLPVSRRAAIMVVAALLLIAHWKWLVASQGVHGDLAGSVMRRQLLDRLPNLFNTGLILKAMFGDWRFILPAALFAAAGWTSWRRPEWQAALLACTAYAGILFVVYMSTPHDLAWHLLTSADRTVLPLSLLLGFHAMESLGGHRTGMSSLHDYSARPR